MFSLKPREVSCLKQDLFRRLTAGAGRVNVLGQNKYVQRIARLWTVRAFIDDFTAEMVHLDKPVIRMADWLKDCIVVSCVMDTLPITALDRLRSVDAREVIDYFGLAWPWTCWCRRISVRKNAQNIRENAARYEQVYGLPVDDVPQQHFAKIVQFRLSMNPEYMRGSTLALDHRYFEDFLSRREAEVFVDGGGYDGQTSLQSAAWNGAHCRIHYFEPAPAMMTVSQRTLAGLQHVHFVQKGLSCRPDRLRFDADGGGADQQPLPDEAIRDRGRPSRRRSAGTRHACEVGY